MKSRSKTKLVALILLGLMLTSICAAFVAYADVTDMDEDGIDDYEEYVGHTSRADGQIYYTDNTTESTDRDPYDDGQEVDGHSPSGLGDFGGEMPASVKPPGNHPLVPSYPDLKVNLTEIDVIPQCTIISTRTIEEGHSWKLETETTEKTTSGWDVGFDINFEWPPWKAVKIKPSYEKKHETTTRTSESTSDWSREEWSTAIATEPHAAAKLKFHIKISNDGTDQAYNVNLRFNVKIGDVVICTVLTGPIANLIKPGETTPDNVIEKDMNLQDIVVTLDQLKSIELGAPISIDVTEIQTEVPWGSLYRDWDLYLSEIEEVSARLIVDFGDGEVRDYRVWSGVRKTPSGDVYVSDVSLEDAIGRTIGIEERRDGVYVGTAPHVNKPVDLNEWTFGFDEDVYNLIEEAKDAAGEDWTLNDLLDIAIRQGWTILMKAPDVMPPEIHWAAYFRDMRTIEASVTDNEEIQDVTAHVKVGDSYIDVELTDEDHDSIFTATLSQEITDVIDDYVIAYDGLYDRRWKNIRSWESMQPPSEHDDWWMFRHDTRHTGHSECSAPSSELPLWSKNFGFGVSYSSPTIAEGMVFFGSTNSKIYCLDENTGDVIWDRETGGPVHSSPAVAFGKVFVGSDDGVLYCLDEEDGTVEWVYAAAGPVRSSPAVADGKVFFNSGGKVYCVDTDGNWVWDEEIGEVRSFEVVFDELLSSPTVADGKVFVGSSYPVGGLPPSFNGKVYCLDADDGTESWTWESSHAGTGGPVVSSPAVAEGKVFVGTAYDQPGQIYAKCGWVYCLDADDGTELWSFRMEDAVVSSPAVAEGEMGVFVTSLDGNLYCLNKNDGSVEWTFPFYGVFGFGNALFSVDPAGIEDQLNEGAIPDQLRAEFEDIGITLSLGAEVKRVWDRRWVIIDGSQKFGISVDLNTGLMWIWEAVDPLPQVYSSPAVANDMVFAGRFGYFVCLDRNDGSFVWASDPGNEIGWSSPAICNGKVVVQGYDGICCFGTETVSPPEHLPPTATIESISIETELGVYIVSFHGSGTDPDGFVVAYNWRSSKDGFLSSDSSFTMSLSDLSPGRHMIYLGVQDDLGIWSTLEDTELLTIELLHTYTDEGVTTEIHIVDSGEIEPLLPEGIDPTNAIVIDANVVDDTPEDPTDDAYTDITIYLAELDVETCVVYKEGFGLLPEVPDVTELPTVKPPGQASFSRDLTANTITIRLYVGDPLLIVVPTFPTDTNVDGKVDMKDIGAAALAFGSHPDHPRWNIAADINGDNKVNLRDIALIAQNFGKAWL